MIGIVTESLSCMTRQDCEKLRVKLMPLSYVINGKVFTDTISDRMYPFEAHSVAPSAAEYYRVFGEYLARGANVICIVSSRKISNSAENAMVAAKGYPTGKIAIIDSKSVAGALHLLAQTARDLEASGAGFTDIVQILLSQRDKITTSFSMNTIKTLREAKRVSRIMHTGGATPILNQKPVCIVENGGIVMKKSVSGVYGEIRELVSPHYSPRRIIVHYGASDIVTNELIEALKYRFPAADIIHRLITMSLRVNLGDGILGVVSQNT